METIFVNEKNLIKFLIKRIPQKKIFLLIGKLGAGKTTLIKKIAKSFKIKETLTSPTFILWQKYQFKKNKKNYFLNHIDLYRIKAKDILKINLKKEIKDKKNIFFIEWGEKIKKFLRKENLKYIEIIIKRKGQKRFFILK